MERKDCDRRDVQQESKPTGAAMGIACMWVLFSAPSWGWAQTIRLCPAAVVTSDQVKVVDVAQLEGMSPDQVSQIGEMVVVSSPSAGQSAMVTLAELRSALSQARLNLAEISLKGVTQCCVHRPVQEEAESQRVRSEQDEKENRTLRGQIRRTLEERLTDRSGRLELSFGANAKDLLELSGPEYTFDIHPETSRVLGRIGLRVAVRRGQEPPQIEEVIVEAVQMREVFVAANTINRGQIITRQCLTTQERAFRDVEDDALSHASAVIGQQAKNCIHTGEMITAKDLTSQVLVRRGELVDVVVDRGGFKIRSVGRAMDKGILGDVIEVRNEASQKMFRGRIVGLQQVEPLVENGPQVAGSEKTGKQS